MSNAVPQDANGLQIENASNIDSVSGLIERVTFFNEETGFAVLRVKATGRRDLVTVIGSLPSVNAGEWLIAEGAWVRDKDHGLQLKADRLKCTPPTTSEGIEKYLGSGMVKGIGPVYAKKLVARFGESIFDIIEQQSARLEEVDGIGPGRRKKIKEAWAEQKFIREIMIFLHSHGVSTSRAVRIYKLYGENAIEKVRGNPYRLASDVPGIGFKTADQIAQRIGIPRESIIRAEAGIAHVLGEALGQGHCALPREQLIETSTELLEIDRTFVDTALVGLLSRRHLTAEPIDELDLIFLPHLHRAETELADRIRSLAAAGSNYPPVDLEKAISWYQDKTGKELSASQRHALGQALCRRVLVITGGPGVGKTTLLDAILRILAAKKVKCLLCAPTGRAAKRLSETTGFEAHTIHRLLEYQPFSIGFTRNESKPLVADLVVVDECSMVDVPLMHALLRAHPPGAALVLVGDVDQLPSVGPGLLLRDIIRSGVVPVVRLTELFRQAAESRIVTAAHAVNQGHLPSLPGKDQTSDFYFVERLEPERIADTLVEIIQQRLPRRLGCDPVRDIQVLCPMNRGLLGVQELNLRLQQALNPARPGEPTVEKFGWQYRLRDKVIQTENDYDKQVFNGDIGQITGLDPFERDVTIDFDGRKVVYDFGELDEVTLAYAITIHKSQGSEFPVVVMPLATQQFLLLQRNLAYTGITRGRRMVVIIGQKKALAMAVRNNRTSERFSGLHARLTQRS